MPYGQPSLQDLPPSLLELCWAQLSLCERHRTVPFVCRSWRQQLNSSPQLLAAVSVAFPSSTRQPSARFLGFCEWMLRHGLGHVRRLDVLRLESQVEEEGVHPREVTETLAALLAACGAAGGLEELAVRHAFPTKSGGWIAAFSTLRRLSIVAEQPDMWAEGSNQLPFNPPPWALRGLEELNLSAECVTITPTAHLPISLTKLHLCGLEGDSLPPQMSTLTELRQLSLEFVSVTSNGFWPLSGLGGLSRLALVDCHRLPACLPQLSGLQHLSMTGMFLEEPDAAGPLQEAWPQLAKQLTCLALPSSAVALGHLPATALTACSRLQSLFLLPYEPHAHALLPGPALPRLRHLLASLGTLVNSLPVLQAATQLEFVGAVCSNLYLSSLPRVLDWAATHPTLRRVALEGREALMSTFPSLSSRAQQQNPKLSVTLDVYYPSPPAPQEFLANCGFHVI